MVHKLIKLPSKNILILISRTGTSDQRQERVGNGKATLQKYSKNIVARLTFLQVVSDVHLRTVILNMVIYKTAANMSSYSPGPSCGHAGGTKGQDGVYLNGDNLLCVQVLMLW